MIKVLNILESGGQIKFFLQDYSVKVNGSLEQRRGRKLRDGDLIEIEDIGTWKMKAE
ncbi:MAG: RNA-binding S4 domain-containing protein [Firmicutes bacterium]|nr:RNA-binding S4 domain-containing protein [Bacillota bacterium]